MAGILMGTVCLASALLSKEIFVSLLSQIQVFIYFHWQKQCFFGKILAH